MLYQLSYVSAPSNQTDLRSIIFSTHHSYDRTTRLTAVRAMERVMGIEPTPSAWKAEVLPLNYTRSVCQTRTQTVLPRLTPPLSTEVVEGVGFEPTKA